MQILALQERRHMKTEQMFNKTVDDEPVCVYVCIWNSNYERYIAFSNCNMQIYDFLQKSVAQQLQSTVIRQSMQAAQNTLACFRLRNLM